jgi:hypothetical protein
VINFECKTAEILPIAVEILSAIELLSQDKRRSIANFVKNSGIDKKVIRLNHMGQRV